MTNPNTPTKAGEAASDWAHLKQYGYAPGDYLSKCRTCGKVAEFVDKRAICCRPCAEAQHTAAPSPADRAASAQVHALAEEAKTAWGRQDPKRLWAAIEALAALATPQALPIPQAERINRLIAAIEGECDGLCVTVETAREILVYIDTGLPPYMRTTAAATSEGVKS